MKKSLYFKSTIITILCLILFLALSLSRPKAATTDLIYFMPSFTHTAPDKGIIKTLNLHTGTIIKHHVQLPVATEIYKVCGIDNNLAILSNGSFDGESGRLFFYLLDQKKVIDIGIKLIDYEAYKYALSPNQKWLILTYMPPRGGGNDVAILMQRNPLRILKRITRSNGFGSFIWIDNDTDIYFGTDSYLTRLAMKNSYKTIWEKKLPSSLTDLQNGICLSFIKKNLKTKINYITDISTWRTTTIQT